MHCSIGRKHVFFVSDFVKCVTFNCLYVLASTSIYCKSLTLTAKYLVNDPNLYYQPPYMNVVSNYEYNKYNNTNAPAIFNISGEPYILMINELLSNVDNNSNVKNIFAKILLSTRAGSYSFNSHIASPTIFYNPLKKLSSLEFKFLNFNGEYFNFNDIDHSFSLKITELIDNNTIKSISSRRNN